MFQSPLPVNNGLDLDRANLVDASLRAAGILRLLSAMRRRAWIFAVFCISGLSIGALYTLAATPLYTA
jgi:hypothetical protein